MAREKNTPLTVVKEEEPKQELNKPTPEEVQQYKEEFTAALKEFDEKKWELSEIGKFGANDVGLYLKDFMNKYAFWSKMEWMGMLKLEIEIDKAIALADDTTGFRLGYQALEYCAYMLSNPGGYGLKQAKEFEAQADKFSKIGIVVGTKVEEARVELKNLQYLQERWAAAEQGFYLSDLEPTKEEVPQVEGNTVEIDVTKKE